MRTALMIVQAKEKAELDGIMAAEEKKEAIIAAERERMLTAAGTLRQYLPASVLRSQKKLPPLHPAFLD